MIDTDNGIHTGTADTGALTAGDYVSEDLSLDSFTRTLGYVGSHTDGGLNVSAITPCSAYRIPLHHHPSHSTSLRFTISY